MRWSQRHKHSRRAKLPRIAISQEEILADLEYPAPRRVRRNAAAHHARRA